MPQIQVRTVVSEVFAASSHLLSVGSDAVVVDAGAGVAARVAEVAQAAGLTVHAVVVSHGHLDHTWDAAELSERLGAPVVVHALDAHLLQDPFAGLVGALPGNEGVVGPLEAALASTGRARADYRPATRVEPLETPDGRAALTFGELSLDVLHAPGHTPGAVLVRVLGDVPAVALPGDEVATGVLASGDVLFAGTIGRTDLPGGDTATMTSTLRDVVVPLDPGLVVLPGHGPASWMGRELATNPFLAPTA